MSSNKNVVTIGIGGASCSGKSVTRLLQKILPNCTILYQDDFFKPEEQIPINSITNLANWDSPEAIDFDAFKDFIHQLHRTGQFLESFESKEENVYNKRENDENDKNELGLSVKDADRDVLKKRREERKGYVTREGYWIDPPNYFDDVVWPEYVKYNNNHLLKEINELT
ncbi:7679_t:CDS:2 [Diversispora eburnea]|uniref:7679_t:CDS:1 n=1 Tax=Diversispora eburnea TaxID=1213867 RepID=A0A9N8W8S0_9GLOM|nr:7679_t:CDS:2 [Diversispora eburnea]